MPGLKCWLSVIFGKSISFVVFFFLCFFFFFALKKKKSCFFFSFKSVARVYERALKITGYERVAKIIFMYEIIVEFCRACVLMNVRSGNSCPPEKTMFTYEADYS